ncbi:MAG: tetratricopeptide repeat protein [FCB group bacterium]|nr:tetratricopeptide repeat protein [FCB group bacterium]
MSLIVGIVLLSSMTVLADETDRPAPRRTVVEIKTPGIDKAIWMIRMGNYNGATVVLEYHLENSPEDKNVMELLAVCYEQEKQYDKLIALYRRQMTQQTPDFQFLENFGHIHLLSGDIDSAEVYFYRALNIWDKQKQTLGPIAEKYHLFGQYRREKIFIDSARIRYGNPSLMALHMGDALAAMQEFGPATLEYLTCLEKDSTVVAAGEKKISDLIKFQNSVDTVLAILAKKIDDRPNNRALLSIYGMALMERDGYDEAFAFYRRQDSLQNKSGGELIHFMRECGRRGHNDYKIKAGEYLLTAHPQSAFRSLARLELAEAYIKTNQFNPAENLYTAVLEDSSRFGDRYEALLRSGLLYKNHMNKPAQARINFQIILKDRPGTRQSDEATSALADIYVGERRFDSAIVKYESLLDGRLKDDKLEAVEFALARIFMFTGNFKEAVTRLRRMMNSHPRGLYVNDAIQFTLIIDETADQYPDQMDLFSSAEYFHHVGENDSLEYYLRKICRVEIPTLAPLSYYHLANLYRNQDRRQETIAAVDSLAANYPQSYYMPLGLKLKADLLWTDDNTRQEAKNLYRDLLEKYGSYPFAAEIRELLRREIETKQI